MIFRILIVFVVVSLISCIATADGIRVYVIDACTCKKVGNAQVGISILSCCDETKSEPICSGHTDEDGGPYIPSQKIPECVTLCIGARKGDKSGCKKIYYENRHSTTINVTVTLSIELCCIYYGPCIYDDIFCDKNRQRLESFPREIDNRSALFGNKGTTILTVSVPHDAIVFINGNPTTKTGTNREYYSVGLKDGRIYKYVVRAQVVRNGKVLEDTKELILQASDIKNVAFNFPVENNSQLVAAH